MTNSRYLRRLTAIAASVRGRQQRLQHPRSSASCVLPITILGAPVDSQCLLGGHAAAGQTSSRRWVAGSPPPPSSPAPGHANTDAVVSGLSVSPITQRLWKRQLISEIMLQKADAHAKEQTAFTPRAPLPVAVSFPFSSDPVLVEQYRNPWGNVRLGRVLEDLDSLAGHIVVQHCDDDDPQTPPPMLVTASVERITIKRQMGLDQDFVLCGQVVWVGRSSLDVQMKVVNTDGEECVLANFIFVARSPVTGLATRVNPLKADTADHQAEYERGAWRAERRAQRRRVLTGELQDQHRERWVECMMDKARLAQDMPSLAQTGWMWKEETLHENLLLCLPQQRNMYGRIFGGFLMRRAFELALASCYAFAGTRPAALRVDDVSFKRPVDVGDLLSLRCSVLHVEPRDGPGPAWLGHTNSHAVIHVQVTAVVMRPEEPTSDVTNTFQFRFAVDGALKKLPAILPRTVDEAMEMYTAAFQHSKPEAGSRKHSKLFMSQSQ